MKMRVAFFDFAGCEGCQLQIANLEEEILDLVKIVNIVSFREISDVDQDKYDVAFIEGSITRPMDVIRLRKIRENAKLVVALGSCACFGGVNALRNELDENHLLEMVYGDRNLKSRDIFNIQKVKAVDEVVKVDFYIPGCPINREEFKKFVTSLAMGKKFELPNYPVCIECKKKGNPCQFEENRLCLGPITMAGCDAICVSRGAPCLGCRGILEKPSTECVREIFGRYNLTYEELIEKWNMFNSGGRVWRRK